MTHSKAKLQRLSHAQLVATIMMILAWIKAENPRVYHDIEARGMLGAKGSRKGKKARKTKSKKSKMRKGKKRATPAQAAARRKFAAFIKRNGRPPRKGERL